MYWLKPERRQRRNSHATLGIHERPERQPQGRLWGFRAGKWLPIRYTGNLKNCQSTRKTPGERAYFQSLLANFCLVPAANAVDGKRRNPEDCRSAYKQYG